MDNMIEKKYRIAICGYGNLGRGVESEISKNKDMELVGIFSRRENIKTKSNVPIIPISEIENWKNKIDVVILCGGSATDLPIQGPQFAKFFNTIDSYDTHAKIPEYYKNMNEVSVANSKISIISVGWDPGLFSLNRLYMESILSDGNTYTFWGDGVSQGHSDAIRRIKGVKNAVQYTRPYTDAIEKVRNGERPTLSTREKHYRECYVVLEENANKEEVENSIINMPNYFTDYNTIVHFISEEELKEKHLKMPHGGFVIRSGNTSTNTKQVVEYSLKLESNPEFTASVLLSYARAACRLYEKGDRGCKTVLDIPPILLSEKQREDIIRELL
ncbi:MAG: diaminopimelate dehydrogenase [Clostridiales bacterium]|nr:diaminopimelate dehydrogenase [Clostridiales bacterium]